jgi:hypothetical protein
MNNKERPFSPETKEVPPIPNTRDLVLIDGQFAQFCGGSPEEGVSLRLIEDSKSVHINPEEWLQYEYTKPPSDIFTARELVEKGLMSKGQLEKVFWGSEEDRYQYLKGEVAFFGTYTKKK